MLKNLRKNLFTKILFVLIAFSAMGVSSCIIVDTDFNSTNGTAPVITKAFYTLLNSPDKYEDWNDCKEITTLLLNRKYSLIVGFKDSDLDAVKLYISTKPGFPDDKTWTYDIDQSYESQLSRFEDSWTSGSGRITVYLYVEDAKGNRSNTFPINITLSE